MAVYVPPRRQDNDWQAWVHVTRERRQWCLLVANGACVRFTQLHVCVCVLVFSCPDAKYCESQFRTCANTATLCPEGLKQLAQFEAALTQKLLALDLSRFTRGMLSSRCESLHHVVNGFATKASYFPATMVTRCYFAGLGAHSAAVSDVLWVCVCVGGGRGPLWFVDRVRETRSAERVITQDAEAHARACIVPN